MSDFTGTDDKGPLAWMAKNPVAANIAMLVLIIGGLLGMLRVQQEVFPAFDLDVIEITAAYPGASPEEVEAGAVLAIEEAVRGIDGVKDVVSTAKEGLASVRVEMQLGANEDRVLSDIKSAVDRITSFPEDLEQPEVTLLVRREIPVSLIVSGDLDQYALRELAEQARDELLLDPRLEQVELRAPPRREIAIEIPAENLRSYGLTLQDVAQVVRAASIELPGGAIKTDAGEILVRTSERKLSGDQFRDIAVLSRPDGTTLTLADIATIRDGFEEDGTLGFYNGKPALMIDLYRVGDPSPLDVAEALEEFIESHSVSLPPGVKYTTWGNLGDAYEGRIDLLLRNAMQGLILVILILGAFLDTRLAFWVTLGIPISFCGSILLFPISEVSFNMVSLFGFIVVLGMVVDDAIVVGEAAYTRLREGETPGQAAIGGVRQVGTPVVFSVLTTVIAFVPLLFVPGISGKFLRNIPIIVTSVLIISLFESLFILPAHLAHTSIKQRGGVLGWLDGRQAKVSLGFERVVQRYYRPLAEWATKRRYLTLAFAFASLIATIGLVAGGHLKFTFMPQIEGDSIDVTIKLPFGAPRSETEAVVRKVEAAATEVIAENGGPEKLLRGVFTAVGIGANHIATVSLEMPPMGERTLGTEDFKRMWRAKLGDVPGVESISFESTRGPGGGRGIDVELSHGDKATLEAAAEKVAGALRSYTGVTDVDDGLAKGKEQLDFTLRPEARSLGVTPSDMARQLRAAFFGEEVLREQRGRDELRVYVRRPREERASEHALETFLLRTRDGGELPLTAAADTRRGRAYTEIERRNGRRIVHVAADIDTVTANSNEIAQSLQTNELADVVAATPGLTYEFGANQRGQRETMGSLGPNYLLALLGMYVMLAIIFRSYIQPIVVMIAIPFGVIGAFVGHLVMGYTLSLISMMGIVALSGVVVNDSIVLLDAINTYRAEGLPVRDAVVRACVRRARPIFLTSVTTFGGLAPMLTETSTQARFLIPMAISLAFGVLGATVLILLAVPAFYLAVEDARSLVMRAVRWVWPESTSSSTEPAE